MLDKLTALSQKLGAGMGLLIGNLVWLLTDQILPMGLGLLVGVWVASYLSGADTIWLAQLRDRPCVAVCFRSNDGIGYSCGAG